MESDVGYCKKRKICAQKESTRTHAHTPTHPWMGQTFFASSSSKVTQLALVAPSLQILFCWFMTHKISAAFSSWWHTKFLDNLIFIFIQVESKQPMWSEKKMKALRMKALKNIYLFYIHTLHIQYIIYYIYVAVVVVVFLPISVSPLVLAHPVSNEHKIKMRECAHSVKRLNRL